MFSKGLELPKLIKAPITREQLKLYAEASGDHNPIHLDEAVAKKSGLPGVIAHGMMTMAFMGEFLHQTIHALSGGRGKVTEMSCRFKAMTFPGDVITVCGVVKNVQDGLVECDLETRNQKDEVTTTGHASIKIS